MRLIDLERLLQEARSNLAVTSVSCNRLKTAARRSHVTRKIPARKLYRVTLICGDHEINSGSIAAITPHAVGQRRKRRTGGSSGARGSPEVLLLVEAARGQGEGRRGLEIPVAAAAEGGGTGRTDGEKRKGARSAS